MIRTYRLKNHPFAQCTVKEFDDALVLQSYSTDVIIFDKRHGDLACSGLYSATTRRHISAFLKEYFPNVDFKTVKKIAGTSLTYNVRTGEVK